MTRWGLGIRTRLAVPLLAGALAVTGCGSDDEPAQPEGSGETASSSPQEPEESPEESPEEAPEESPSVTPATGPALKSDDALVRLPQGSRPSQSTAFTVSAILPDNVGGVFLSEGFAVGETTDEVFRAYNKNDSGPDLRRQPDVTMAGRPAFHGTGPTSEVAGATYGTVEFVLAVEFYKKVSAEERARTFESILATWEWR